MEDVEVQAMNIAQCVTVQETRIGIILALIAVDPEELIARNDRIELLTKKYYG